MIALVRGFLKLWPGTPTNLIAAGTKTIKSSAGFLSTITINNPGVGVTIAIYDNITGSGTLIGTITPTVTTTLFYNASFSKGLTIVITVATTAPDITVSSY